MEKLIKGQEIYVVELHKHNQKIINCTISKIGRIYFEVEELNVTFEIKTMMDKINHSGHAHSYNWYLSVFDAGKYILKKVFLQNIKSFKDFDSLSINQLRTINEIIATKTNSYENDTNSDY